MSETIRGYFNLTLLVAFMCGAYAIVAHGYGWDFHTNLLKGIIWQLS